MIVHKPESLEDVIRFLTEHPEARIVAGGTDLLPRINQKLEKHETLCYIDNIPEMREINVETDGSVFVGALVRLAEIKDIAELTAYTALLQAASKVASPQIRNQATIGGNILQENRCIYFNNQVPWSDVNHCFKWGGNQCFQYKKSPECVALFQSDVAPALIAFGALAVIYGPNGTRKIPVAELYLKAGFKNISHNEVLLGILLPPLAEGDCSAYVRKTIRGSFDFPLLSCAVRLRINENVINDCTVVFGAAGVMPAILKAAEEVLNGQYVENLTSLAAELNTAVPKVISPFQDTHINAPARNDMAKETFTKAIAQISQAIR